MLLFKLKAHVTASFSADLRDMTLTSVKASLTSVNARFQELRHSCIVPTCEAAAEAALRDVYAKNRPTGVNERSFVKKFVRENLKRIIFECSNIRCSSTHEDFMQVA